MGSGKALPLVTHGDLWHYWAEATAPQNDWRTAPDEALAPGWQTGPGGFGYGDGDDATTLSDMRNGYRTVAIRRLFVVTEAPPAEERLILRADYDDGFIAYLDGVEIARRYAPGSPGADPVWNVNADGTHEASRGNNSPQPIEDIDCGPVGERLAPGPHVLAIIGYNDTIDSSDFSMIFDMRTEPELRGVSGVIEQDTTWRREESPYEVIGPLTVADGATLTIEPGVEVRFGQGVGMTVQGQIRAEGTAGQPIVFTRRETALTWRRIEITGHESVFRHCSFHYGGSSGTLRARNATLVLDHCRFADTEVAMVDLKDSSCLVTHCVFPGIASSEPFHFDGMPPHGQAYIAYNRFGAPKGYNDVIDFTGGNRPGPIVEFIGNIFEAGVDEVLDMDGTDAHIEGNVFFNVRKDGTRSSSSSAISTGASGSALSELVICRNWFYNVEHVLLLKDRGTAVMQHNTALRISGNPYSTNPGEAPGLILFGEPWRNDPYGKGAVLEGNVFADLQVTQLWPLLAEARAAEQAFLVTRHNLFQGLDVEGTDNLNAVPLFVSTEGLSADNLREQLLLQPASPGLGQGPYGLDMGAGVKAGVAILEGPLAVTVETSASFTITGPGIWSFRWKLDEGEWSEEIDLVPASVKNGGPLLPTMLDRPGKIELTDLAPGAHTLQVQGRNSAGRWQEEPAVRFWTVVPPPQETDSDGDGLPDDWEAIYGLDPHSAEGIHGAAGDMDGDGQSNLEEFWAGTEPHRASSRLALTVFQTGDATVVLEWTCVAGRQYRLAYSQNLAGWSYVTAETGEPATYEAAETGVNRVEVPWPASRPPFWRVEVAPAP